METKAKTLFIRFEEWRDFSEASKSKKKPKLQKQTILFPSVTDYQKYMTEQKVALLATIANQSPNSIYELAQLVERNFANVQRDCVSLHELGFLHFTELKNSRQSKKPERTFPYNRIEVHTPKAVYAYELEIS